MNSAPANKVAAASARDIEVRLIPAPHARAFITRNHYSGKYVRNSSIHFGAFLNGKLHGCMQFGSPMDKRKSLGLVPGTPWNGMLELNRMAFDDSLPRNSESRCIAVALRMLRKQYPQLEWILSFADATQCGDGTIYRASGFVLTSIKKNNTLLRMPDGSIVADITFNKGWRVFAKNGAAGRPEGAVPLDGFQLRYIYFYTAEARARLSCDVLPFSAIQEAGATMYKGKAR